MIGIVVVTHNRIAILKEVIDSLRNQTYKDYKIIVINNGSTDGSKEWIETQVDITAITQDNVGGAGGFFTGMKYVAEMGYEYCWIMDDDVICSPSALDELVKAIRVNKKIGFVCSKVVGIDGYTPMNVPVIDTRPIKNGYTNWFDCIDYYMIKVRSATFVSVLLSTERIYELGLPYKEFFIWGDDTEYTLRITNKYDSYIACKSVVIHKRAIQGLLSFSTENDNNRLKNYFYMFRNMSFTTNKLGSRKDKIKFYMTLTVLFCKLLLRLKFKKVFIILKSQFALLKFFPKIQYPHIST
jgi:GT2 family glycosyltransferase